MRPALSRVKLWDEGLTVGRELVSQFARDDHTIEEFSKRNREIAERLTLSENTIKKHVKNILEKLHVNNRVQAAIYAKREGIIGE